MKYVAIKSNDPVAMEEAGLPIDYPLNMTEHESEQDAYAQSPECVVMSVEDYNVLIASLRSAFSTQLEALNSTEELSVWSKLIDWWKR